MDGNVAKESEYFVILRNGSIGEVIMREVYSSSNDINVAMNSKFWLESNSIADRNYLAGEAQKRSSIVKIE